MRQRQMLACKGTRVMLFVWQTTSECSAHGHAVHLFLDCEGIVLHIYGSFQDALRFLLHASSRWRTLTAVNAAPLLVVRGCFELISKLASALTCMHRLPMLHTSE